MHGKGKGISKNKTAALVGLLMVALLGIHELSSRVVLVNPVPADSFEYEFDLLNGQVTANPFGK